MNGRGFQCVWLGSAPLQHNCILSVKYFFYTQPTLPVQGLPGVHSQQCECLPLKATYTPITFCDSRDTTVGIPLVLWSPDASRWCIGFSRLMIPQKPCGCYIVQSSTGFPLQTGPGLRLLFMYHSIM